MKSVIQIIELSYHYCTNDKLTPAGIVALSQELSSLCQTPHEAIRKIKPAILVRKKNGIILSYQLQLLVYRKIPLVQPAFGYERLIVNYSDTYTSLDKMCKDFEHCDEEIIWLIPELSDDGQSIARAEVIYGTSFFERLDTTKEMNG